jgi:curved DNA-binding protein CbpA
VPTPYSVLEVPVNADTDTIKAAFRAKAKRFHPDLNHHDPAATRHLRRLIRARDILLNPERRANLQNRSFDRIQSTLPMVLGAGLSVVVVLTGYASLKPALPPSQIEFEVPDAEVSEFKALRDWNEGYSQNKAVVFQRKSIRRTSSSRPFRPHPLRDVSKAFRKLRRKL